MIAICPFCKGITGVGPDGKISAHRDPHVPVELAEKYCDHEGELLLGDWDDLEKVDCLKCRDTDVALTSQGRYINHYVMDDGKPKLCDFSDQVHEEMKSLDPQDQSLRHVRTEPQPECRR